MNLTDHATALSLLARAGIPGPDADQCLSTLARCCDNPPTLDALQARLQALGPSLLEVAAAVGADALRAAVVLRETRP